MSASGFLGGAVCWPPDDFAFFFLLVLRFFFLPVQSLVHCHELELFGQPTINKLATGLYGGSSVVVLILPVFVLAAERSMKQATGRGGLGRIDVRNGSAGR
jgi:hypothetical protein